MYKFILLLFISNCIAQNALNVDITGNCLPVSGVFNFQSIVNGKNNYLRIFVNPEGTATLYVAFDGTKWVLHNGTITDAGFINVNVPAGIIPPLTGWQVTNCGFGTMVITENLSNTVFLEDNFKIYPNPAKDFICVSYKENQFPEFTILDLLGRKIMYGNSYSNEKINIENLKTGNYIIQIQDEFGGYFNQKFIKN